MTQAPGIIDNEEYEEPEPSRVSRFRPRKKQIQSRSIPYRGSRRKTRFSEREKKDLLIASILVILVSISMMGFGRGGIISAIASLYVLVMSGFWWAPVITSSIFLFSFMAHEMAHKFTAQKYGMWSEFRMTVSGYYLSLIAILFSFPIFGTGAVFTSGTASEDEIAKSNLAGPLTNFVIASILSVVIILAVGALGSPSSSYALYVFIAMVNFGVILNGWLGLFNMIPFQPFDGGTVFAWNRVVWAVLTIGLVFLMILGYLIFPAL